MAVKLHEVYFKEAPFKDALRHFKNSAENGLEALGLLTGRVYCFQGEQYVVVEDYITGENEASGVSVSFSRNAFKDLSSKLKGKNIVGWVHSHPGFGCFLSSTDIRTQECFFNENYHFAFVIDPVNEDYRAFKLRDGVVVEVSFVVVKE
ncbi:MAG: Mov34/MPN/PAD-1 family protein [Candidatus Micrarchaeota archaeon]